MYRFAILLMLLAPTIRAQDMPLSEILIPGEGWKKIDGKARDIRHLTSHEGNRVSVWDGANKLVAEIDVIAMTLKETRNGEVLSPNHFTTRMTFRDKAPANEHVTLVLDLMSKRIKIMSYDFQQSLIKEVLLPLDEPNCGVLSDDRGTMFLGDAASKHIWAFRVADNDLSAGEKFITLRVKKGETRSGVTSIRIDPANRIFAATNEGVQIFDPTGRLCGVLLNPGNVRPTAITFAGRDRDLLFASFGDDVYNRKLQTKRLNPKK